MKDKGISTCQEQQHQGLLEAANEGVAVLRARQGLCLGEQSLGSSVMWGRRWPCATQDQESRDIWVCTASLCSPAANIFPLAFLESQVL